ncbi:diguanylate cyclase [Halopseudomonas salina]|uniref:Diguanylate cyclase n=2 Tax=Halopseudomonas salina TaxID=1323744 RepID=A0ABQ1PXJ2_9GAMM|nr:diguanylate cyclase [Halopseudomonas salina]
MKKTEHGTAGAEQGRSFQLSPAVMDLLLDAICVVDAAGRLVYVSGACERIFGYQPQEMIGRAILDLVHPDDLDATVAIAREVMLGRLTNHFENRYIRKDGSVAHIMWSANWSEKDQLRVAVAHDITERKHTEAMQAAVYAISEAASNAANLPILFRNIHEIIGGLLPASVFCIALHNPQDGKTHFPYSADEKSPYSDSANADTLTLSNAVIRSGQPIRLEAKRGAAVISGTTQNVSDRSLDWLAVPLATIEGIHGALVIQNRRSAPAYSDKDQQLLHYISTQIAAAIHRASMRERLEYLSRYDQLTSLPNRALLSDRINTALARARREKGKAAVLYLDLDKFKLVNDTHGHAIGDQLLKAVADRVIRCVRESDTVSRIGGDEFVILLEALDQPQQAHVIADKIREALNLPLILAGLELIIIPSIGIALYPDDADEEKQLLDLADSAMYRAKRLGGNRAQRVADSTPDSPTLDPS